ncbi:MAG: MASE1 domain-containing protein, partial [Thermoplasmatota archaeon]
MRLAVLSAVAVAYATVARLGLLLATVNASASPVWPATGVAIAAVLLFGWRAVPAVLAGAFAANAANGTPWTVAAAIAAGNGAESLAAGLLLKRWANGARAFERVDDLVRFAWAAAAASMASATIGVLAVSAAGLSPWPLFGAAWATWWLGDAVGAVVAAPLIVLWLTGGRVTWWPHRGAEAALLLACTGALGAIMVSGTGPAWVTALPLGTLLLGPVAWAAFRFGPREAAAASGLLCGLAVWAAVQGHGPFEHPTTNDSLLLLQSLVGAVTLTGLALAVVVAQRDRTQAALRAAQDGLELGIRVRTQQLGEMLERFKALTEGVPLGIFHTDSRGRIDLANARWMQIAGCASLDQAVAAIHPEDRPALAQAWKAAREQRGEMRHAFRFLHEDGTVRWVQARASPVLEADGSAATYVGYVEDVTDMRAAEADARRTASLLNATLESTQDGILVVDLEGHITSYNRNFAAMWRIPPYILESHDDERAVAAVLDQLKDPPGFVAKVKELYGQPYAESADTLLFKDGRTFERYSKPQWLGRQVVGRVWSFRDVTARLRVEAELRESQERMLTAAQLQTRLIEAQLQALQRQLHPHFLFNTLANVQALVDAGSPHASAVLRSLVAYLRAAVPVLNEPVATIERELQLVRPYLELMQMRMPD